MKEHPPNALAIPKKVWVFLKMLTKISRGNGRNERGSRGCSPWDASPFGGVRGSHSYYF
jgi:hypothetical protein